MKLGSEPECTARSTESIPTKNTNRKKERDFTDAVKSQFFCYLNS